ncbi:hypothetical protein M378DRAFT_93471, partial [Amanita muscaria Koide BX008]
WIMYDGTIVVLYARPAMDGDAYYTRKCNYGLNLQVGHFVSMNCACIDLRMNILGRKCTFQFTHCGLLTWSDWGRT